MGTPSPSLPAQEDKTEVGGNSKATESEDEFDGICFANSYIFSPVPVETKMELGTEMPCSGEREMAGLEEREIAESEEGKRGLRRRLVRSEKKWNTDRIEGRRGLSSLARSEERRWSRGRRRKSVRLSALDTNCREPRASTEEVAELWKELTLARHVRTYTVYMYMYIVYTLYGEILLV